MCTQPVLHYIKCYVMIVRIYNVNEKEQNFYYSYKAQNLKPAGDV